MLGSITPLGERSRGRRWGVTVTAFGLAAVAAGGAGRARCSAMRAAAPASRPARAPRCSPSRWRRRSRWTPSRACIRPARSRQVNEEWLHALPRLGVRGRVRRSSSALGVTTIVTHRRRLRDDRRGGAGRVGARAAPRSARRSAPPGRSTLLARPGACVSRTPWRALDRRLRTLGAARPASPPSRSRAGSSSSPRRWWSMMRLRGARHRAWICPAGWDGRIWTRARGRPGHACRQRRRCRRSTATSPPGRPATLPRRRRRGCAGRVRDRRCRDAALLGTRAGARSTRPSCRRRHCFTAAPASAACSGSSPPPGGAMCLYVVVGSAAHASDLAAGVSERRSRHDSRVSDRYW